MLHPKNDSYKPRGSFFSSVISIFLNFSKLFGKNATFDEKPSIGLTETIEVNADLPKALADIIVAYTVESRPNIMKSSYSGCSEEWVAIAQEIEPVNNTGDLYLLCLYYIDKKLDLIYTGSNRYRYHEEILLQRTILKKYFSAFFGSEDPGDLQHLKQYTIKQCRLFYQEKYIRLQYEEGRDPEQNEIDIRSCSPEALKSNHVHRPW